MTFHGCFLPSFDSFGKAVSEKKIFLEISVTAWPNESKFGRNHPWKVLYKHCSFISDPLANMAATGNSCF
jgi:hypothetical protein